MRDLIHKKVVAIQWSLISPEEQERMAVVVVKNTDGVENGIRKSESLYDPKMGTISRFYNCATCGLNNMECPGHMGIIKLARPVLNILFMKLIENVLKCMCFKCNKFFISPNEFEYFVKKVDKKKRLRLCLMKSRKLKKCPYCEFPIGNITSLNGQIYYTTKNAEKTIITAESIYHNFSKLSANEAEVLGFHPVHSRP